MAARHEQIGQRASHEQAMGVLLQSAIAHLGKAEHPLDDADRMLDPSPHFGLGTVFPPLDLIDNTAVTVAAIGEIPGSGRMLPDHRSLSAIGLVTPHTGLLPMQQLGQHRAVGDIGGRRRHRVDQLAAAVDPEMRLHPEIPLIALPGLMHLGIARLVGILGRDGALMIVASTIVPVATFKPFAARCRWTSSNSCRPRSCASSRWRKRHTVVSSGTGSRPRSMLAKRRIASES